MTEPADPSTSNVTIVENSWSPTYTIDYENKYFLNSTMPWFGTATLSQKLSEKGIITEATATVDSQIDELVASVASIATGLASPIASVKVAKIEADATKADLDIKSMKSIEDLILAIRPLTSYKLVTEEKGYLYTFSEIICDGPCNEKLEVNAIPFDTENGNYTRITWPIQKVKKTIEDKPTIGISGSIILPEE